MYSRALILTGIWAFTSFIPKDEEPRINPQPHVEVCAQWLELAQNNEHEAAYAMMVKGQVRNCEGADILYYRARVLSQSNKTNAALEALESLFEKYPNDERYAPELSRVLQLKEMKASAAPIEIILPSGLEQPGSVMPAFIYGSTLVNVFKPEEHEQTSFPYNRSAIPRPTLAPLSESADAKLGDLLSYLQKQDFDYLGQGVVGPDSNFIFTAAYAGALQGKKKAGKTSLYQSSLRTTDRRLHILDFCNNDTNDGFPAYHRESNTLIFASDRNGGSGKMDLWKSTLGSDGWSTPVPLSSKVNTKHDELFPEVHGDTLYFSSNREDMGFGGMDIYAYCFSLDSLWNMGYPINGPYHDFRILFTGQNSAVITSDRPSKYSGDKVFTLRWALKESFFEALVGQLECTEGVVGQTVVLIDLKTKAQHRSTIEADGSFIFSHIKGQSEFEIQLPDVPDHACQKLSLKSGDGQVLKEIQSDGHRGFQFVLLSPLDYHLERLVIEDESQLSNDLFNGLLQAGASTADVAPADSGYTSTGEECEAHAPQWVLYFGHDNAEMEQSHTANIEDIVQFAKANPRCRLLVEGRADARGNDWYNDILSLRRAAAIARAMEGSGIEKTRIRTIAHGGGKPLNHCAEGVHCTEEEHGENRCVTVGIDRGQFSR